MDADVDVDVDVATLARDIRARAGTNRVVVLLDGRTSAGKTTLAASLAPVLDAQLVHLDNLYPGWDGLSAGSAAVHETVLRHENPGWTRWNWARSRPAEWHPVDPDRAILIEGCGAISRANRALANYGIWLELDAAERHRRFLARDGGRLAPFWQSWTAQEDAFIARENPRALADRVLWGRAP